MAPLFLPQRELHCVLCEQLILVLSYWDCPWLGMQSREAELKEDQNNSDQIQRVWKNLWDANVRWLSLGAYFYFEYLCYPEFAV